MPGSELTALFVSQLTSFASEVGQLRAEVTNLKTAHMEFVQKLRSLEDTCKSLEILWAKMAGELTGRTAIQDRASVTTTVYNTQTESGLVANAQDINGGVKQENKGNI